MKDIQQFLLEEIVDLIYQNLDYLIILMVHLC